MLIIRPSRQPLTFFEHREWSVNRRHRSQKRRKLGLSNLHCRLFGRLVSGSVKLFHKFERGYYKQWRCMRGVWENLRFLANKLLYLRNGTA